jgi:urea carboxylase-associated protein 2
MKEPRMSTPPPSIHRETLRGGASWSRRIARHQVLSLVDVAGRACVSALFYNAHDALERYNMADTLKAQYTAYLTRGRVLYSDMGRILCSIIVDTCGHHDTLSGSGDARALHARFGEGTYQVRRNEFHRNARDNFLIELGKHGLGPRDVVANVNFFVGLDFDGAGALSFRAGNSHPGAQIDLRFEMDTLAVLTNTPHPLDPRQTYDPPPVELTLLDGVPPGHDDLCRTSRPENGRGFELTEAYARELGALAGRASTGAR